MELTFETWLKQQIAPICNMLDNQMTNTILPVATNTQQSVSQQVAADEALLLLLTGQTAMQLSDAYALVEPGRPAVPSGISIPSVPQTCDASI